MDEQWFLTTIDNPYDPYDDFIQWFMFDTEKGYNTCGRLMRIADVTDDQSDEETEAELERAMDEIIKYDFLNVYQKVKKNTTAA